MSCLVCFLYAVKAVLKIVSKFVEEVAADETWDIVEVCSENDKNVPGWPLRQEMIATLIFPGLIDAQFTRAKHCNFLPQFLSQDTCCFASLLQ